MKTEMNVLKSYLHPVMVLKRDRARAEKAWEMFKYRASIAALILLVVLFWVMVGKVIIG